METVLTLRLQRNTVGNTVRGMDREHEIELRVDRSLVKRFKVGGQAKGTDFGILIAIQEDEVEQQRMHTYRLSADSNLEFRIPMKAGTHLVSAAFLVSASVFFHSSITEAGARYVTRNFFMGSSPRFAKLGSMFRGDGRRTGSTGEAARPRHT